MQLWIRKELDKYIGSVKPFLNHKNPYTLLLAVVLSAQTTDKKVNEVTAILFKQVSEPQDLISMNLEELEFILKPLGFYKKKALFLKNLSRDLIDKFHGKVPQEKKDLLTLQGVGEKTASVVLSQAFKKEEFPVDTHVFRLAHRWNLSEGKTPDEVSRDLKKIFPKKSWNQLHLQMIQYGRDYCTARNHVFCPICEKIGKNSPKTKKKS